MIQAGQPIIASDFISTSAGAADVGKAAKLNADGQHDESFIPLNKINRKSLYVVEDMDGSTTPVAVFINSEGYIQKGEADVTGLEKFIGFCTENISGSEINYINSTSGTSATLSFTAQAGTNRVAIVQISVYKATGLVAPTSVTYNGNAMTLIDSQSTATTYQAVYSYVLGTNASSDPARNIVVVGGTYSDLGIGAICYGNVNQTTPTVNKAKSVAGSGTSKSVTLDPTNSYSKVLNCFNTVVDITAWGSSQTQRLGANCGVVGYIYFSDVANRNGASTGYSCTVSTSTSGDRLMAIELNAQPKTSSYIAIQSKLAAFSGLTLGAKYYLSNTAGAISTSVGSTTVLLGKALSATEMLIIQS